SSPIPTPIPPHGIRAKSPSAVTTSSSPQPFFSRAISSTSSAQAIPTISTSLASLRKISSQEISLLSYGGPAATGLAQLPHASPFSATSTPKPAFSATHSVASSR